MTIANATCARENAHEHKYTVFYCSPQIYRGRHRLSGEWHPPAKHKWSRTNSDLPERHLKWARWQKVGEYRLERYSHVPCVFGRFCSKFPIFCARSARVRNCRSSTGLLSFLVSGKPYQLSLLPTSRAPKCAGQLFFVTFLTQLSLQGAVSNRLPVIITKRCLIFPIFFHDC